MTIYLPTGLPAADVLRNEGIQVEEGHAPVTALRIGLFNLMPDRIATELQFARILAATGMDCELVLLRPAGYIPRNTPSRHMDRFYETWSEASGVGLDGLIVTGAPVEKLEFESVAYWSEMEDLLFQARGLYLPTFHICWAAQAALYVYHGVPKHLVNGKVFGVFDQTSTRPGHELLAGLGKTFPVPVSRHTEVRPEDLPKDGPVEVLAESPGSGLCLLEDRSANAVYMFNHFEYDADTLDREYRRDVAAGLEITPPHGPSVAAGTTPPWRYGAVRFFRNWLRKADGIERDLSVSKQRFAAHA